MILLFRGVLVDDRVVNSPETAVVTMDTVIVLGQNESITSTRKQKVDALLSVKIDKQQNSLINVFLIHRERVLG